MTLARESTAASLERLSHVVARLGGIVETQVTGAVHACVRRDTALARDVIEKDARADAAQKDADRLALAILTHGGLRPAQVREVMAGVRIAAELERVGDLAKSMSKRTLVLNEAEPMMPLTRGVERMGRIASELLKHALDGYAHRDLSRAVAVWKRDEEIDAYYNTLFRELLAEMTENARTITACAHLLFVAKNLERMGDHATNIAEAVHHLITGIDLGQDRPKATAIEQWPASDLQLEPKSERPA